MSKENSRWKKPGMFRWYRPSHIAKVGVQTLLSTAVGSMMDRRLVPSFGADESGLVIDYRNRDELWFDYAADIGDGWDATYTMAYLFSAPEILPRGSEPLPRGDFLILGGDEVYPTPSKMEYARRLVWPFNAASRNLGHRDNGENVDQSRLRDLYCIPGNHDWYDNLAAFTRRFCNGRWIGSFRTRQTRSYFVLKLPHKWQVWGIDIQLGEDVDVPQWNFFKEHAKTLEPNDKVILCVAQPGWVYGERTSEALHFNIELFEKRIEAQGARAQLELAGDIHNYQRYEQANESGPGGGDRPRYAQTKLVSGGGGAFLHPTHTFSDSAKCGALVCKKRYPSAGKSRCLSLGNLAFCILNPGMSVVIGLLYVAMFWSGVPPEGTLPQAGRVSVVFMGVLFASLIAFVQVNEKWPKARVFLTRVVWGGAHAASHVYVASLCWAWVPLIMSAVAPQLTNRWLATVLGLVFYVTFGGLLGGTLFGLYLCLSVNALNIHENESFSAIRVANYKHLLRFHLTEDALRLHVVAVDKIAPENRDHPVATHVLETRTFR